MKCPNGLIAKEMMNRITEAFGLLIQLKKH